MEKNKIINAVLNEIKIAKDDENILYGNLAKEFSKMKGLKDYTFPEYGGISLKFEYDGKEDPIEIGINDDKVYWMDFTRKTLLGKLNDPKQCRKTLEKEFEKIDKEKKK